MTGISLTNDTQAKILKCMLLGIDWPAATNVVLALFIEAPGEAGGGTECTDVDYLRQFFTVDAPEVLSPTGSRCATNAAIDFPAAVEAYTLVAIGLYRDSDILPSTGGGGFIDPTLPGNGTLMAYRVLDASVEVPAGGIVHADAGNLSVTVD